VRGRLTYGPSGNSGESGSDFEEEIVIVAEAIGHSLDALEEAGMERPSGVGEDSGQVFSQSFGEVDEGKTGAA
jgi:hypothetical protein